MNFFEHQDRARRRTALLVLLFTLAVLAIVFATNLVVLALVAFFANDLAASAAIAPGDWLRSHPDAVLWTSLVTVGLIGGASLFRMASLASGGGAVAQALGGVLVDPGSNDPLRRQLRNVVEETAIAAGIPAPDTYVLESEGGINAFAAGFGTSDAAIAVTRGALETLTRDELQGVIAHEFSHILNGDMRLNTRLIGLLFGILVIALVGRLTLRGASETGGRVALLGVIVGLALVIIGYTGLLFGSLIKAAVSRSREQLADASAVQFTRLPAGLAGALKKIAAMPLRPVVLAADVEEVRHMLIAEHRTPFGSMFTSPFATHPPILERIRALDPRFDPSELERIRLAPMRAGVPPPPAPPPLSEAAQLALAPLAVIAAVGNPGTAQLSAAARRLTDLPPVLHEAAHSPQDALAMVLALVLSRDPANRARQLARLRERVQSTPELPPRIEALASQTTRLDASLRLPLMEIAFPALRHRPVAQLRALVALVDELLGLDGQVGVLDYTLGRLLRVQLTEALMPNSTRTSRAGLKLHALKSELQTLFSVMARSGHDDERSARAAFDAGMRRLLPMAPPEFEHESNTARQAAAATGARSSGWIADLDHALTRLDFLPPAIKQALIEALVMTVAHDRQVTLGEAELLRVVCASLHCPLPPLVADAAA